MANFLARRACQNLFRTRLASALALPARQHRSIHVTTVVQKKKAKGGAASTSSSAHEDDLFGDLAPAEDDLFKEVETKPTSPSSESPFSELEPSTQSQPTLKSKPKKAKLTPAERHKRFEAYMAYVTPRLGRNPEVPNARVKKRSLFTLIQLAQNGEELGRVMELLPRWKESRREVLPHFAEAFVRRCQELACPTLALTVFGDYSKYQLPLTLPAAQWLLHALHMEHPIEQLMVATSLYPVYHLPLVSEDLVSAAMVAAACYRHGSEESVRLAEELRPHVERLLVEQRKVREGLEGKDKRIQGRQTKKETGETAKEEAISQGEKREARKKLKWIAYSLRSVNKACEKRTGKEYVKSELIPSGLRLGVATSLLAASTLPSPSTVTSTSTSSSAAAAAVGASAPTAEKVEARP